MMTGLAKYVIVRKTLEGLGCIRRREEELGGTGCKFLVSDYKDGSKDSHG